MSKLRLPGLIDVHVHLREPGATQKEDFYTGSRAALRGGFTYILDMPNNSTPTVSIERLNEKIKLSGQKAVCDIGFHYGTNGLNTTTFKEAARNKKVFGLKLYCNHTTGEMLLEDLQLLEEVFSNWKSKKPILVHAEGVELAAAIALAKLYGRKLHVCHITQAIEVELVRLAKKQKQDITSGVCPHHLFLTGEARDKMGSFALMKPPLGTQQDQDALWKGLNDGTIDVVETDHAPHTLEEKKSATPPYGVPGLETALSLMVKAVKEKKFPQDKLIKVFYKNPRKIFNIPVQPKTYIEVNTSKTWKVGQEKYETKCGWSPFEGWELPGVVEKVVFKGKTVIEKGKFLI
jgi:dihydroorotase-like cyclic amidohydrolase